MDTTYEAAVRAASEKRRAQEEAVRRARPDELEAEANAVGLSFRRRALREIALEWTDAVKSASRSADARRRIGAACVAHGGDGMEAI